MTEESSDKIVWTIGHSTHSLVDFIALLSSFKITALIDIRNYPGSKRLPHFNKEALEKSLPATGVQYIHMKELGGRRKPITGSTNTGWKNDAFRGYADYMATAAFKNAAAELEEIALKVRAAYMCSEALWWRCHRALISDYLKIRGWNVLHILNEKKAEQHPYTSPARIINGELGYEDPGLF